MSVIVGGIPAEAYDGIWDEIGARRVTDLNNFRQVLRQLRNSDNLLAEQVTQ